MYLFLCVFVHLLYLRLYLIEADREGVVGPPGLRGPMGSKGAIGPAGQPAGRPGGTGTELNYAFNYM